MWQNSAELFFNPFLLNSQKALMALYENDIPFTPKEVNVFSGRSYDEKFLSISPQGEVPVLRKNGQVYSTFDEILKFIDQEKSEDVKLSNNNTTNLHNKTSKTPNEMESYTSTLLSSLDYDALFHGSLCYFEELGLKPGHPYNSHIFREKMKSMTLNLLPFILNRMEKFPAYSDSLEKRYNRLHETIATVSNKQRFNALLNKLTEVFDLCENELKSRDGERDGTWLFTSDKVTISDIHFGLLLHHLHELGYEATVLWRNHPRVDRYYRRFTRLGSFLKVICLSYGETTPRWKMLACGILMFGLMYGATHYWITSKNSKS